MCAHTSYTDYKKFMKRFKNNTVKIALPLYKTVKELIGQIAHLINFDPNSKLALPLYVYTKYIGMCVVVFIHTSMNLYLSTLSLIISHIPPKPFQKKIISIFNIFCILTH